MQGPKWPFLLRYGSRDTRRIDFQQVDGLSTVPRVLGRHRECSNVQPGIKKSRNIDNISLIFWVSSHPDTIFEN